MVVSLEGKRQKLGRSRRMKEVASCFRRGDAENGKTESWGSPVRT